MFSDEPGEDARGRIGTEDSEDEDVSDEEGTVGNTEGDGIQMSAAEAREARGMYSGRRLI